LSTADDEPATSITRIAANELETTEKGIAIQARYPHGPVDPFDSTVQSAVLVPWRDLLKLTLVDPWPCVRLRWRTIDGGAEDVFGPHENTSAEAFARAATRLSEATTRRAPQLVHRGWLDVPDVPWEPVSAFPRVDARVERRDLGAFRTSASDHDEHALKLLARRGAPATFDALFEWLRSGPDKATSVLPRAMLVTQDADGEDVYVRWRDERCERMPLAALRTRTAPPFSPNSLNTGVSDDAFYVFGRATRVLLTRRSTCAVAQLFDQRLAKR
jgi:hypothetical protein